MKPHYKIFRRIFTTIKIETYCFVLNIKEGPRIRIFVRFNWEFLVHKNGLTSLFLKENKTLIKRV